MQLGMISMLVGKTCGRIKSKGVIGLGSVICTWPRRSITLYKCVQVTYNCVQELFNLVTIFSRDITCVRSTKVFFSSVAVGMEMTWECLKFPFSLAVTSVSMQIVPNRIGINSFDAISSSPFL